jgi:exosortase/archaeosortase family protein
MPSPSPGFLKRNRATIQAVIVFFASLVVFFWLLNNNWVLRTILDPFTAAVARVTVWLFLAAGQDASVMGKTVTVNSTTLSIATGCNGVEAMALYFAAVLALPALWTRRLIGIGIGVVGIFLINQIRVVGLFLVAMYRPEFLPQAHHYAGQTFVIVMGMALWFFWAEQYAGFRTAKSPAPAR